MVTKQKKRYWEELQEYWDETGEEEKTDVEKREKWREVKAKRREDWKGREGTTRENPTSKPCKPRVREPPCCIASECYTLSKREDEEGETERR